MRSFEFNLCVDTPDNVDVDTILDAFIEWVEDHGWVCGGGVSELDEDGEPIADTDA